MAAQIESVNLARVSSKGQEEEGYSLDSQVKLLAGYSSSKGLNVKETFKITESASKSVQRKTFQEMMQFIEDNDIKHLVVEKVDRHVRNLHDAVETHDWLMADENRQIHFVKDSLVMHKNSRSQEWLNWGIRVVMAKNYIDNLREEAMKGWAEKLAQGWLPAPPPPGYVTVVENGKRIHVPNPKTKKAMQKMFKLYLEPGQSIMTITEKMAKVGLTTRFGRPFSHSHVQKILKNPFYIGINHFDGKDYPGAQIPLITTKLFDAVQAKMSGGRPMIYNKHNPVLKNMIFCSFCGGLVTWQKQKGRYYGSCQRRKKGCKGLKYIKEEVVEEMVKQLLERLICPSDRIMKWVEKTLIEDMQSVVNTQEETKCALEQKIARLRRMEDMLYDDKLSGDITAVKYQEKHLQITDDIKRTESELKTVDEQIMEQHKHTISIVKLSQNAAKHYANKAPDEKRDILIELFETMRSKGNTVSVKYTKLAQVIANKSEESREILQTLKLLDRTNQNKRSNRDRNSENEVFQALQPIWQGHVESNHDLGFWRPL